MIWVDASLQLLQLALHVLYLYFLVLESLVLTHNIVVTLYVLTVLFQQQVLIFGDVQNLDEFLDGFFVLAHLLHHQQR